MKIKRIIIFLLIALLPLLVNAEMQKNACTIVSGNGKDIGSEIACGTEHFYIIENNNDNIKMIAKYNLYVGINVDKVKIDTTKTYIKYECGRSQNCSENPQYYFNGELVSNEREWLSKFNIVEINHPTSAQKSNWDHAFGVEKITDRYDNYQNTIYEKLYPYYTIKLEDEGFGLQNELARGVTGEKGNADYPIYAVNNFYPKATNDLELDDLYPHQKTIYNNFKNGYTDTEYEIGFFDNYKSYLIRNGFIISNVDLISIQEINNLVYKLTNTNLPLEEWYQLSLTSEEINEDESLYHQVGDLKEYLSDDYSWLWNTTYWTKTLVGNNESGTADDDQYFISSQGEICYSKNDCRSGIPRAGFRPVVTISKDNIKYKITTKTDGNGTIEVLDSAYGGESIVFKVSAKRGFKLSGLTVTADSGEKVEFSEQEISTGSDGTMSISTNKFTMPYENVLIEAKWKQDIINPQTGVSNYVFIISFLMVISLCIYFFIKNSYTYNL